MATFKTLSGGLSQQHFVTIVKHSSLAHAKDDTIVSADNTVEMRAALKAAGVKVETHLFTAGQHGLGLPGPAGEPARHWKDMFTVWAQAHGLGGES